MSLIGRKTVLTLVAIAMLAQAKHAVAEQAPYRSPLAIAASPDGKTIYVSDKTALRVTVIDVSAGKTRAEVAIPGEPNGLVLSADGKTLYVAERKTHAVAVVDTGRSVVVERIDVGRWPVALAIAEKQKRLYTCNRGDNSLSIVDLNQSKQIGQVTVVRQPACLAITPDESRAVVANLLPQGAGTDPRLAAEVSIIDTASMKQTATVKLPSGSTVLNGLCISPDGNWAYVVHALGRFNLPITQLERGWVHTYALSIIDVSNAGLLATVLLDDLTGGAADPWGIVCSADGNRLWISHAGTSEISTVQIARVHELLNGKVPEEVAGLRDGTRDNIWVRISRDRGAIPRLVNDLTALYIADTIRRAPAGGNGCRGLALSPDGRQLYVANYFSGTIGVLEAAGGRKLGTISLGQQPQLDAARRGEIYFHDARRCFQHWHSCASCHPDGRVDGLPWDFMRDGIGNGKDVISLVQMHNTSPHNRRATRADSRECIKTGVIGSHLIVPEPSDVDDLLAYVESLEAEPNPNSAGAQSAALQRGKLLFDGKAKCAPCHPGPYFTDRKMHNVGIISPLEPDGRYDTPSLIECYRTAPYYHDGRAATLEEALTRHDPKGLHGDTESLKPEEIDDLVAYLLSL